MSSVIVGDASLKKILPQRLDALNGLVELVPRRHWKSLSLTCATNELVRLVLSNAAVRRQVVHVVPVYNFWES